MKISAYQGHTLLRICVVIAMSFFLYACGGSVQKEEAKPVAETPTAPAPAPAPKVEPEPVPEQDSPVSVSPAEAVPNPEPQKLEPVAKEPVAEPAMEVPKRKGPNHHIITVAEKKPGHPAFGKGHKKGFFINGGVEPVVIKRGQTYEFEVRTDPLHDVYFSRSAQGWGGAPIVEGISGQFTYDGIITVKPDTKTPNVIYYSCRNHNSMGWKVLVVDARTSDADIARMLDKEKQELARLAKGAASKAGAGNDKGKKARQKLSLAGMMLSGAASKRVMAGDSDEAKTMLSYAKTKIEEGDKALKAGDGAKAFDLAGQALNMISTAQRLVPSEEELKVQAAEYEGMLITVEHFEISHKEQYSDTLKRRGKKEAVDYDKNKVKTLVAEAKSLAAKKQYLKATANLTAAEQEITAAIQQMMDKQVVEYTLNFETPKDEWEYEFKRYKGYEELVPVAVEQKKPNDNLKKLMDMYVKKGMEQRDAAVATAAKGDYPLAIAMILSATEQIRLGLKTVGVSQ